MKMPVFLLQIKAQLQNVDLIARPEDCQWCLTLKNSVGEDVREGVYVSIDEEIELTGSRGTANFAMKWEKDSRKEAYLNLQHVKGVTRNYKAEDSGNWVPIIAFECRGLDPIDLSPEDNWNVVTSSGQMIENVDLSEKEYYDVDDKGDEVSITELEWKFTVHKG